MKKNISKINIYEIDAGWRNWFYLEIVAKNGLKGYAEIAESNGPKDALSEIAFNLLKNIDLSDYSQYNNITRNIDSLNKQGMGGTVAKCRAAISNALLDLVAKDKELSITDYFGGKIREEVSTYWSHCGTTRLRTLKYLDKSTSSINTIEDFIKLGKEVTDAGFDTLKTNLISLDPLEVIMPSYTAKDIVGIKDLDKIIEDTSNIVEALNNENKNKILLDVGYNLTNSSLVTFADTINSLDLGWIEIDFDHLDNFQAIKELINVPICSGENYTSYSDYIKLINSGVAEVISIDPSWNSLKNILEISSYANLNNQEITLHNHYSNLSTYIALNISQLIDKFSYMEVDVDDVPWKNTIINLPNIKDGKFIFENNNPGWGFEINTDLLNEKLIDTYTFEII